MEDVISLGKHVNVDVSGKTRYRICPTVYRSDDFEILLKPFSQDFVIFRYRDEGGTGAMEKVTKRDDIIGIFHENPGLYAELLTYSI